MPKKSRDRAWADYTERFRTQVVPKLLSSSFMIQVGEGIPEKVTNDVIQTATELGVMLLLNKPLIILVPPGYRLSSALRRAAAIVLDNFDVADDACQDRLAEAIKTLKDR